ncbi:LuxR family two component transcriptional regulator [Luteimonas cucumeris]|jgi:NarL family two-component system response regulator LiaR|uniref:LuxR family two component transcriptional regulator n=1 Tax=Luteimonas cucumeris TaxID=985012 RepID=A0A562LAM0_9GAMM|nr:response regulator transcription factor [Luteimonas cucumeris]TWI04722.1 LuxR family two component transcriptional regulator [Luteimonas cucumeris]
MAMRLVLADDHQLVRAGLRSLLGSFLDVQVLAECGDGHEALALVDRLQPDVLLLDITLPGLNGLEVARRVPRASPSTRVLILSMHAGAEYVTQALRAGVAGYLIKDSAVDELRVALDAVHAGRPYLSPAISQTVLQGFLRTGEGPPQRAQLDLLTPRQRETLQLIAEGYGTREIAARLNVSVKTVESHRSQIMERLDIHDVPGLVRLAIRLGLVSVDSV